MAQHSLKVKLRCDECRPKLIFFIDLYDYCGAFPESRFPSAIDFGKIFLFPGTKLIVRLIVR